MYRLDLNNIRMLLSYHDVFDENLPDLKSELSKMNLNKTISIICELIAKCDISMDLKISEKMQKIDFQGYLKINIAHIYGVKDYKNILWIKIIL